MSDPISDPRPILDLIDAFRKSKTMFAAVSLGIFDGARPDVDRRLLEGCAALGLLEKRGAEFVNTAIADEYLRSDSARSLSGYIRYSNAALYPMWAHLEDAVVEGSARWTQTFGLRGGIFEHFFKTEEAKRDFLQGMHGFGMLSSPAVVAAFDLSRFRRIVDLGGATGHLAMAARARYPQLRATLFDLPPVLDSVNQNEIECIAGDFFTDALPESDLYALGRILHDWTGEKIRLLLRRVFEALEPGGALLLAERLLDEDHGGPVSAAMQSLNMLICTEGRERSLHEYAALLEEAGFREVRGRVTGAPLDAILALKPTGGEFRADKS